MRWFIGVVALVVICVIFGSPAVLLLGWRPLTVSERQIVSPNTGDRGPVVSH